jgi:hypothetical protein
LDHPPYFPEVAPSIFNPFPKLKEHLRLRYLLSDVEVKMAVKKWFRQQDAQFYRGGLVQPRGRCRKYVDSRGDYIDR